MLPMHTEIFEAAKRCVAGLAYMNCGQMWSAKLALSSNFQQLLHAPDCCSWRRRRRERLSRRARLQNQPETAVPRLQPITHREGSATLAPALQV